MSGAHRWRQIAVIGSSGCAQDSEIARLAEEVGRRLAEAGVTVVCGGGGGVMEAVSRGAAAAGGRVIGIVPGICTAEANPYCTEVVASGIGPRPQPGGGGICRRRDRVGGEWGTLSEIGQARAIGRTVVALRSWELSGRDRMHGGPGLIPAQSAEEAVAAALAALSYAA